MIYLQYTERLHKENMMRHIISTTDWTTSLADAIEVANNGDTIVCHNDAMVELGKRARSRMCPNKTLTFELNPLDGV